MENPRQGRRSETAKTTVGSMIRRWSSYLREIIRKLGRRLIIEMLKVTVRRKIARYLKVKRDEAGLSIEEASNRTGVSSLVIRSTEQARYSIPLCDMTALVKAYGADQFQYVMFINRLGIAIHRKKRAIEKICSLSRLVV